jgi:CheY-like chemotaxis protein
MFSSVLTNIINNAIKYTSKGSVEVSVSTGIIDGAEKAIIKVKDSGIGIEPDKLPVIFKEFRQGSEGFNRVFEGLGIGLTITKKFVELMNGTIEVTSSLDVGTEFVLEFYTYKNDKPLLEKKTFLPSSHSTTIERILNILIVEDEEINRSLARLLLRKTARTEEAINALEAIEKCRSKLFDIILMDINLGKGMNGLEAAREIKKLNGYEKAPIVAVTAYTLEEDESKYLSEGCTHYLPKPYSQVQLLSLINEIAAAS